MKPIVFINFLLIYNLLFINYDDRLYHHIVIYLLNYVFTLVILYNGMKKLSNQQFLMLYFMNMVCTSYLDVRYVEIYDRIDNWCHINIMTFAIYSVLIIRRWCSNVCSEVITSIEEDIYKI